MFNKAAKQARLEMISLEVDCVMKNHILSAEQKNAFMDGAEPEAQDIISAL